MLELFDEVVDALEFARDVNLLWAVGDALAALDAVVGLAEFGHTAVVADEECSTSLCVVRRLLTLWHVAFVHAFIIMYKYGRDVEAIRARHTIVAVVAVNRRVALDECCRFALEPLLFLFGERFKRGIRAQIVLKVLHVGHAAQHGEHCRLGANVAECPRCHAVLGFALLEVRHDVVGHLGQPAAKQGFHDDDGNLALHEFVIQIFARASLVFFVVPIDVVRLYLYKVPMIFFMMELSGLVIDHSRMLRNMLSGRRSKKHKLIIRVSILII